MGFLSLFFVSLYCLSISVLVIAQTQVEATWNAFPFNAPALPLAVKTPYLNAWLSQGSTPVQNGVVSPLFWNIQNVSYHIANVFVC